MKSVLHKRTWERLNGPPNSWFAHGAANCYDVYDELGSPEMYMYQGENNSFILDVYNSEEDSWHRSLQLTGSPGASPSGGEYAGNALAWTSLSHIGGLSNMKCYGGTTTTINLPHRLQKNISGSKIRIISGDNAGYEGVITSHPIGGSGTNCTLTIDPPTPIANLFCVVEIYAGSVFFMPMLYATPNPPLQVYDISTDSWFAKAFGVTNEYVQYSIKLTSLPQLKSEIDTATVTSTKTNLFPSSNKLTVGGWSARTGTEIWFDYNQGAPYPPSTWNGEASTKIIYTSGDGYVWSTGYRFKPNTTYTYSIYIRSDVATPVTLSATAGTGFTYTTNAVPGGAWQRFSLTFTTPTYTVSQVNEIGFYVQSSVHVFGGQVEEGNSATDLLNTTYTSRLCHYNFIRYSTGGWSTYGGVTIATGQTDPFGGTTAALCTDGNITFGRVVFDSTIPSSTINLYSKQVTMSCWLKTGTATTASMQVQNISAPFQTIDSSSFTLTTEWKRYSFTATFSGTHGSLAAYLYIGTAGGINEGTLYAACPQLEYGPTANDYIATSGGVVGYAIDKVGSAVTKISLAGKNYLPGSLKNYRARYTVPSYYNLMTHSEDFTNNSSWTTTGGSSKTGTTLNTPVDNARCDVRPQLMNGYNPPGTYTFSLIASGSGTFTMYSYNAVILGQGSNASVRHTLSATPQKFSVTYTYAEPFSFPVFGRMFGDTATAITVHSGQLVYSASTNVPYVATSATPEFAGGIQYAQIIDNDADSISIEATMFNTPPPGTVITIEPNGDEMYVSGNNKKALYLYNQRTDKWLTSEVAYGISRSGTVGWEQSANFINKIDGWSIPQSVPLRLPSTAYTYGDKVTHSGKYNLYDYNKGTLFECTTPGTTAAGDLSGYQFVVGVAGTTATDNGVLFTKRFIEQPGRYIYSFRGAGSGFLDIFDIATGNWYPCDISQTFKYSGCAIGFTQGTTYAQDKNYIYIITPFQFNRNLTYRFDVKNHKLEPWVWFKSYAENGGPIQSASKSWVSRKKIGNETVSFLVFAGARYSMNLFRCREL